MLAGLAAASHVGALLVAGRLAIVASASTADGQPPLRYAERDADRVAAVLRDLGGFDRVNQLRQARPPALRQALADAEAAAARDPSLEVIFYYSGHADAEGLLLGSERLPFAELRARLEGSKAAVRVALLDACYAGGMVRPKGGAPAPGYALDTVEPPRVRGAAIIAAGTASELAQESGDIEGSYFTHHVLSALRGAGDRDENGVVTLAEAYQYAYSRTLAATLPSVWGPQHPSYEYKLSGTGDLVMTRVGRERRALSFPPAGAGSGGAAAGGGGASASRAGGVERVYVVSTAADEVVAEVRPSMRGRVRLVVPRGRYRVVAREGARAWLAEVTIDAAPPAAVSGAGSGSTSSGASGDVVLEASAFREVPPALAFAKGGRPPPPRNALAVDVAISGLGPGAFHGTPELGAGYLRRAGAYSFGPHLSFGATDASVLGVPVALARLSATAYAFRHVTIGASELQLGAGLGLVGIRERVDGGGALYGLAPTASAAIAFDLPLQPWLALRVLWSGGVQLIRASDELAPTPELRASLGAVFRR